jgi:hypothetical protein
VGSEMCIRDRYTIVGKLSPFLPGMTVGE